MKLNLLWSLLFVLTTFAVAQANKDVKLELKAFRVVTVQDSGKTIEKLEAALDVKPGQVVEYQVTATNTTDRALSSVGVVIPIPRDTRYQALSAQPLKLGNGLVAPEFSFTDKNTFGKAPLKRKVRVTENGQELEKEVEVKPEEYTFVRWTVPQLAPKESVVLKLRTVVR